MIRDMDDIFTTAFAPLVGLPCWGVERGQGSILSFEFGSPHLLVREPYASHSLSAKVRQRAAERLVKPVGMWNLFVFCCHWHVTASGAVLADDNCSDERIEAAARAMNGQKLIAFALDTATRGTIFSFDLGAILTTSPYTEDNEEQWSLYLRGSQVLTYRSDGCYSFGPSEVEPGLEVWQTVAHSVSLP